jgi:hypothetical protein
MIKTIRRVCIGFVVLGAIFLFARHGATFETVPFPADGLRVKMDAEVTTEGDYYLRASMPRNDQAIGLSSETIPCLLSVSVVERGKPPIKKEVTSLTRYAELGFAEIQYYKSADIWHLRPGEYEVDVSSRQDCKAAVSRGATLSVEQDVTHLTERYLGNVLRFWSGVVLLCGGLMGIIFCEFKNGWHRHTNRSSAFQFFENSNGLLRATGKSAPQHEAPRRLLRHRRRTAHLSRRRRGHAPIIAISSFPPRRAN